MKNKVLEIVKNALIESEDSLKRTNMEFGKMSAKELENEYGQSGRTCSEVLNKRQIKYDELKRCVAWVERADWRLE